MHRPARGSAPCRRSCCPAEASPRGENFSPASDLKVRRFVSKCQPDFSLTSSGVRTLPSFGKGTAGIVTTSHSYTSAIALGRLGCGPMCCVSGTPGPACLRRAGRHQDIPDLRRRHRRAILRLRTALQAGDRSGDDRRSARRAGETQRVPGVLRRAALRVAVAERRDVPAPRLHVDDLAVVREPDARARHADRRVARCRCRNGWSAERPRRRRSRRCLSAGRCR